MRSWEGRPRGKCGLIGSLILLVPNVVVNSGAGTGGSLNVIRISPSLGRNGLRKRGETSMSKQERKEREYITNDPTWPQDHAGGSNRGGIGMRRFLTAAVLSLAMLAPSQAEFLRFKCPDTDNSDVAINTHEIVTIAPVPDHRMEGGRYTDAGPLLTGTRITFIGRVRQDIKESYQDVLARVSKSEKILHFTDPFHKPISVVAHMIVNLGSLAGKWQLDYGAGKGTRLFFIASVRQDVLEPYERVFDMVQGAQK
jgi:hypothetical protein